MKKLIESVILAASLFITPAIADPIGQGPIHIYQPLGNGTGGTGTVTSINNSDNTLILTPNPITATGTISLNLGNANSWSGIQTFSTPVLNGTITGTGVSQSSSASTLVQRDANSNAFSNNFISTGTSTATAGGTTILTASSSQTQIFTGTTTQTIQLPDATTLTVGFPFRINNNSTGNLTINNNGGSTIYTMLPGQYMLVTPLNIGTSNGLWDVHSLSPANSAWGSSTLELNTSTNLSPEILTAASNCTTPGFIPQRGSSTTGLGGNTTTVCLISNGVAILSGTASTLSSVSVPSASFGLSGNITGSGIFGTTGIRYKNVAATLSDTTSSGTIAANYDNLFGGSTLTATSATTLTVEYGAYFKAPTCSTNVTCTNIYALGADSSSIGNTVTTSSGVAIGGCTIGTDTFCNQGTATFTGAATFTGGAVMGNTLSMGAHIISTTGSITASNAGGFEMINQAASATLPTFSPNRSDLKAGIGAQAAGSISIIGDNAGTATEMVRVTGTQTLLLNLTTGTNADFLCLSAGGVVLIQASACTISSLRFKRDVKTFTGNALSILNYLDVDTFYYRAKNKDMNGNVKQLGLIAEDVAQKAPICAEYEPNMMTPKSYKQECVIALLVKGVQEQQNEISKDNELILILGIALGILILFVASKRTKQL